MDKLRNRLARMNRTPEQILRDRESNRRRQRKYRERHKEDNTPKSDKVRIMNRKEKEKQRQYWKNKQSESRANRSSQKVRRKREKDCKYLTNKKDSDTTCIPAMSTAMDASSQPPAMDATVPHTSSDDDEVPQVNAVIPATPASAKGGKKTTTNKGCYTQGSTKSKD